MQIYRQKTPGADEMKKSRSLPNLSHMNGTLRRSPGKHREASASISTSISRVPAERAQSMRSAGSIPDFQVCKLFDFLSV